MNSIFAERIKQLDVYPGLLRFRSPELEQRYLRTLYDSSLEAVRLGLLLGILLFTVSIFFDWVILNEQFWQMLTLRLGVLPVLLLVLVSVKPTLYGNHVFYFWAASLSAGLPQPIGVIWFGQETVAYLNTIQVLACMFASIVVTMRFSINFSAIWVLVSIQFSALLLADISSQWVWISFFTLFVSGFVLTIALYKFDLLSRSAFIQSLQSLEIETRRLQSERERAAWLEKSTDFLRHEMRNSVAGIKFSLELLERETSKPETERYFNRARRSANVISRLLESVGHTKSLESSIAKEPLTPVELYSLLNDQLDSYRSIYPEHSFVLNDPESDITVMGTEERLIQVIDNIISNAVDHSLPETPIELTIKQEDQRALFSVANQGPLLPENKTDLFDLFVSQRGDNARESNIGVGLYVVKLIVEHYSGKVIAKDKMFSGQAVGAVFEVTLPLSN